MTLHQKFVDTLLKQGVRVEQGTDDRPLAKGQTFWRKFSPEDADDNCIFYVHGTGNDHLYGMYEFIQFSLRLGLSFYCFDLDGHGTESSTILSSVSSVSMFDDAFHNFRERWPQDNIHILCNSFGGLVTVPYLPKSTSIKSLGLMGVPFKIEVSKQSVLEEAGSIRSPEFWKYMHKWGRDALPAFGPVNRSHFPVRLEVPQTSPFTYVEIVSQATSDIDLEEYIKCLKIESIAIIGERDSIAPSEPWLVTVNSHLQIHIIEDCNHFLLPIRADSIEAYCDWLRKFL